MILYHFLPEKWALQALKTQRLKVSQFDDLNDPFELMAISLNNQLYRSVMNETKKKLNEDFRILCLSKSWKSPLLWGHYADKHRGIALVLNVPKSDVKEIIYSKHRPQHDLKALMNQADSQAIMQIFDMLSTKYEQWSYEEEARVQFPSNCFFSDEDLDFVPLGERIKLVGMVLGPLNGVSKTDIEKSLPIGYRLEVTTSTVASQSFDIIKNPKKPPYILVG